MKNSDQLPFRLIIQRVVLAVFAFLLLLILANENLRANFLSGSGIASGALIVAVAIGIVLTYRGSGVVNFSNGAIAMYAAYVYAVLRSQGDLFLPPLPNPLSLIEGPVNFFSSGSPLELPDLPTKISFGDTLGLFPALTITLLFCILLGLALHFLIFKPLRHATPLTQVVASVGVFLLLQAIVVRRFAATPRPVKPIFQKSPIDLPFGINFSKDQLIVSVLVVIFTLALWALFRFTRFGLATRAAAENEKGAIILGFSPEFLSGVNWTLSTVVTGLLGVLVASINTAVDPATIPALIVPALTAALVGNFSSFGLTAVAGFLLGMQSQLMVYLGVTQSWFPRSGGSAFPGMDKVVPLLVIVLVLYIRGDSLPIRGGVTSGRLPFSPYPSKAAVRLWGPSLIVATAVFGLFLATPSFRLGLTNSLIGVMICLSAVVLTGFVGQISLSQMAFAGISGFLLSKLATEHGVPFPIAPLLGALVAMFVGVLVALPALRVRGVNLAIVTLAFGVAVEAAVFKNSSVNGGLARAIVVPPKVFDSSRVTDYKFLGITIGDGLQPNPMTILLCLIVTSLMCYLVVNLRRSGSGRRMLATRNNERAAAAVAVNVAYTKIMAFGLSAFIAGLAGAISSYRFGSATPEYFTYTQSLVFFAFAYLGGISSVTGAIAGGVLVSGGLGFTFLENILHVPSEFTLILGGLGLITTAILNPEGLAGGWSSRLNKVTARFSHDKEKEIVS